MVKKMIATTYRFRNAGDPTDSTWCDTSSQTSYWINDTSYHTSYCITKPTIKKLSLKELNKIWSYERMIKWWFNPIKKEVRKIVTIKPIPLRCVILNGYGWANQK